MTKYNFQIAGVVAVAGLAMGFSTPAAAMVCRDGYQLVQGNYISTPYCQDELLARVARQYGMKASAGEIRQNPNFKRYVCLLVGRDIRVYENCLTANPTGRRW